MDESFCSVIIASLPCRWGADICPCCDSITCCNSAWKSDKPLPTDDYRQEAMQYEQNQTSQRKLQDEEANVSSGAAYPSATPMTVPVGTAVPMNVPAAGTQQHVAPPTY
ncbi:hypothetical protein MPSI1_002051 [Malassezia psittaci]|uniref:Uncharacterized protein n=1 Tax=Malassezia psittaci TaxID=1821823 RepID=A0AAF0F6N3_9BASI|nr:hypothetical protein MPSI1_002051 [Malassezia psittaci]